MTNERRPRSRTDRSTDTVVTSTGRWDRGSETSPVHTVVSAVSRATGMEPLELPPLFDVVDSDALNALMTSESSGAETEVAFRYAGCEVSVRGDGTVRVRRRQGT